MALTSFDTSAGDAFVVRDSVLRRNGTGGDCNQSRRMLLDGVRLVRNGTGLRSFLCEHSRVTRSAFVWNGRHLALLDQDIAPVTFSCTSFTRAGGGATVPVEPCGAPARSAG